MRKRMMLFEKCMTELTIEQIGRSVNHILQIFETATEYEHIYFCVTWGTTT